MRLSAVSKPQYYGVDHEDHIYVIKLKRDFYPRDYPSRAGIWIGVTISGANRSESKKEADYVYQLLSNSKINDVESFNKKVAHLGYFLSSVD